jgi:hypothetical protein
MPVALPPPGEYPVEGDGVGDGSTLIVGSDGVRLPGARSDSVVAVAFGPST